ncbi:hypothetical protein [Methylocystis heyeri]|uniref:Uncharacterized protein n=1 Tax=Methylocystis heyeri TaxID=391905 RepID=A0A6B8K9Y1_9HYPH|nr:hypothetical protein [Methylocystis heyeri]QGM45094.1 hypothetical protein H2LOC_004980 [Methylocystis heyeri]
MNSEARRYVGDADQMRPDDGLMCWVDGTIESPIAEPETPEEFGDRHLWVVTTENVHYAPEACDFGKCRGAGATKHSNLTGGGRAFVGGELVFLEADTIAITGCSGRYRLRSGKEMAAIERAFVESGYNVWSMGYNEDTNRPHQFGLSDPKWISL